MNRFIDVPTLLYSSYEADLLDKNPHELECINVIKKINVDRIESYGEAIPLNEFSEDNKCWTTVIMFSGNEFIIDMPMHEFDIMLKNILKFH